MSSYEGLSAKNRVWILTLTAVVAFTNLAVGWWLAIDVRNNMQFGLSDAMVVTELAKDIPDTTPSNQLAFISVLANNQYQLKAITNKQSVTLLVVASGFALIAVGFGLFLIGADGAFKVSGEKGKAKILLSGTAPGILCFTLAAILIGISGTRYHNLQTSGVEYQSANQDITQEEKMPTKSKAVVHPQSGMSGMGNQGMGG